DVCIMPSSDSTGEVSQRHVNNRRKLFAVALIFVVAILVRVVCWHDTHAEATSVQSSVASNYKQQARLLEQYGFTGLFRRASPVNDPDLLGHPPGYPILIAIVYKFAKSDAAMQVLQIFADGISAILIFLIAAELLPFGAATI